MSGGQERNANGFVARPRPAFDHWCREYGIDNAKMAVLLGCSRQMVHAYRRPFGDPKRKRPGSEILTRISNLSEGRIGAEDFVEPVASCGAGA